MKSALALSLAASALGQSIVDIVCQQNDLSTLCDILNTPFYATAKTMLSSVGNYTLMAPWNVGLAEAKINKAFYNNAANVPLVSALLNYHVLDGAIRTTDLSRDLTASLFATQLTDVTYTKLGRGTAAPQAFVQSPEWPYYNYLVSGRPTADWQPVNLNTFDLPASNGLVQVIAGPSAFPQDPLTHMKAAGYTQFVQAINKVGVAAQLQSLEGATFLPITERGMDNLMWQGLSAADLKTLVLSQVIPKALYYADLSSLAQPITATALSGVTVTVTAVNGAVYLGGPGTTNGVYPHLQGRVVQPNILAINGVVHGVDRPNYPTVGFPVSKVPYVPTQWQAETIDPPQGAGTEQYNFLDDFQSSDWNPSGHWFQYPDEGCAKLESKTGANGNYDRDWYLGCDGGLDCCYVISGTDIKEWQLRADKATDLGTQTIQSFGQDVECYGWQDDYSPFAVYKYWFTTEAGTNKPILHRIDVKAETLPPLAIEYANFTETPQDQSAAWGFGIKGQAGLFNMPSACDAFNILECSTTSADDE